MGSMECALLTGFICRLCSEMHRAVTHIYGEAGRAMRLADKINKYLPVNVKHSDPLPKTICNKCVNRLESQHKLVLQIELVRQRTDKSRKIKPTIKKKKRKY